MAFLKGIWGKWQHLLHDDKWKHKIYVVIFESDTPAGKWFDVALIGKYALSFFGIIDLLATLPLYIGWFFGTARYLLVIRTFRLIRVFRIFKLFNFLDEGNLLLHSLTYSSRKIIVFFLFVLIFIGR